MLLNLSFDGFACPPLEVDESTTVLELKSTIELQTAVQIDDQELWFQNSRLASDGATLREAGVRNNDVVHVRERSKGQASQDEQRILNELSRNQEALQMLPLHLRSRIQARDPSAVAETIQFIQAQQAARQYEEIEALNADEFDPEAQAKIAERIKLQNIQTNLEAAYEHSPEIFAEILMLYVSLQVNGHPIKAFVDSGAQACVMSLKCAEECSIAHLIDTRYQGILQGVGTQKMYGRVHSVSVKVGAELVPMSVTIIENTEVQFLFGLDMLRRYRCCIDLENNCLRFGTLEVSIPFLPDHEVPKKLPIAGSAAAGAPAASAAHPIPAVPSQPQATSSKPQAPALSPSAAGPSTSSAPSKVAPNSQTVDLTSNKVPQSAAQPSQPSTGAKEASDSEDQAAKVQQLMSLGFPQQMAEEALKMCGGNVEHAASILFSQ